MSKILWPTLAAAIIVSTASFVGSVVTTEAATIYPWCAHYGGRVSGGAPSCGSVTFAQCMATVSGTQGFCDRNPWYSEQAPTEAKRIYKRARG